MSRISVMEDLDALLADLHSTTTSHLAAAASSTSSQSDYHGSGQRRGSGSPPPPLPPPPAQDVLDSLHYEPDQPIYEVQSVRPVVGQHSYSSVTVNKQQQGPPDLPPRRPVSPPNQTAGSRVSLTSNLSELDTLLQDLSTAQFMPDGSLAASGDRRNGAGPLSPHNGQFVGGGERSVDSLLCELEHSLPGQRATESPGHYEAVNVRNQPPPPSNASQELDDLMASLSDFKLGSRQAPPAAQHVTTATPQHVGEPAYALPNKLRSPPATSGQQQTAREDQVDGDHLEAMMGNLQSDMQKRGVNTVPKGHCAACMKPIVGQVITALASMWHPEHFICACCHEELGTQNFFERDGQPYCERDYHRLFSPKCAACSGPILDKCVTALDKTWHPEHFLCDHCGQPFGEDGFHERNGVAYCRTDYFEMFAPKCGGCLRPIMDNYINALSKQWHPECFVCRECRSPFGSTSFYDLDGFPYCETHYHAKRGSLCASCQKPITGRCITAMYKKFHPEHFVCAFCMKQLNKGTFKEQDNKPYCHPCFIKLFG